jgi:hypothetical protein
MVQAPIYRQEKPADAYGASPRYKITINGSGASPLSAAARTKPLIQRLFVDAPG